MLHIWHLLSWPSDPLWTFLGHWKKLFRPSVVPLRAYSINEVPHKAVGSSLINLVAGISPTPAPTTRKPTLRGAPFPRKRAAMASKPGDGVKIALGNTTILGSTSTISVSYERPGHARTT